MRTKKLLAPVALAVFALASLATLERSHESGSLTISARNDAQALFCCSRFVAAVKRAVAPIAKVAQAAAKTVTSVAKTVATTVKAGVQAATKVVTKVANAVVKGVQGVAELAKKGLTAIADAVKNGLLALGDLLKWVWEQMRDKLLKPVGDYFKGLIDKAKAALDGLVKKALAGLQGVFMDKVIAPAMKFAFEKLFPNGQKALEKIKDIAQRILGKAERVAAQADAFAETVQAFAEKNMAKYEAGLAKFDSALDKWTSITLADLAGQLVEWAREKVEQFVRGKTVELLSKAYELVEGPINLGKTAALSAISSIPFCGGAIAGAADVVITMGLKLLRSEGFKFIANKAGELAGKAVDWVGSFLVKGAGALDAKIQPVIQPIIAMVKPWVEKALGMVTQVKDKWKMLRTKLGQAKSTLAGLAATK